MPNLDLNIEGIEKEMSVNAQGVVTFTLSGGGRALGLADNTLSSAFSAPRRNSNKLFKFLTSLGIDPTLLAEKGIEDKVFALIAYFYSTVVAEKYRTEEAKLANLVFSAVGVRKWGQDKLGWKPPTQSNNDQVLLLLGEMRTEMNSMREEITAQNNRVNLMLPSYQMMQKIKPALSLADGKVQALMEKISQNLEDFHNQEYLPIRYFLRDLRCTRGETISIGKAVNGFFKGFTGKELPTKYAYKNSHKLYPECAKPVFEYVLESNKR